MILTSEYVYNIFKLNETQNIIEITLEEYERKYAFNYNRVIKDYCIAEFLDKKNETKSITIDRYNIIGEVNKIMQSSKGMIKFIRVVQVKVILEGKFYKNIKDIYFKSGCMPILWKKFYIKITNDRNDKAKRFIQNCCEKHYCHFKERWHHFWQVECFFFNINEWPQNSGIK